MAAPQVNKKILGELEVMGFPTVRSIRALHYSGNSNLESAVNWLLEHESDPDIDQLPLVPREISIECGDTSNEVRNDVQGISASAQERKPEERTETGGQKVAREISIECGDTSNEVRNDVQGISASAQERKPEERTETGGQKVPREISIECGDTSNEVRNDVQGRSASAQERKPEERTETGGQKELSHLERELNADENEEEDRKRILSLYKEKRDEEGRKRRRTQNQLQDDKRERIRAAKDLMEAKRTLEENQRKRMMESRIADQEEKRARERIRQRIADDKAERRRRLGLPQENQNPGASVPIITSTKVKPDERVITSEQLRDCLRTLKKNHKDDSARVTRAFQILLKIIVNIVKNPAEEKFRRIRLSNPVFKDRVGSLPGGVEFLELCGFQRLSASGYLAMPRDKVDMALLNAAGVEVVSAMENPYFGLLSK